jgi:hypothetical protein
MEKLGLYSFPEIKKKKKDKAKDSLKKKPKETEVKPVGKCNIFI